MAAAKSDSSLAQLELGEETEEVIEEGEIMHLVVNPAPAAAALSSPSAVADADADADADGEVELVVSAVRSVSLNPAADEAADAADAADDAADDDGAGEMDEIVVV